ncbi:MAG: SsrA-binding protein SmpB [Vampirovibrionales bacterium]|nr:SsrA-binding protein SmpB [Vampirovibrionales bacterium]
MTKQKDTSKKKASPSKDWLIASNKKAYHEYTVLETYQTGIVLTGSEIKSIREGKVSLKQSYARLENGEIFLFGAHIAPYEKAAHYNHDPERPRKLLLTKAEIRKLVGKMKTSGLTLIPLKMYFKRCWVKIDLGVCKGKKLHDKRDSISERDSKRDIARALKTSARSS